MEPAHIQLPLEHQARTKILSVACGRAHTVVHTEEAGEQAAMTERFCYSSRMDDVSL